MAIPTYYRTAQEWKEPFTPDSRSSPTSALSLDHFEELALPDVYFEEFEQTGDAHAFAEAYAALKKPVYLLNFWRPRHSRWISPIPLRHIPARLRP